MASGLATDIRYIHLIQRSPYQHLGIIWVSSHHLTLPSTRHWLWHNGNTWGWGLTSITVCQMKGQWRQWGHLPVVKYECHQAALGQNKRRLFSKADSLGEETQPALLQPALQKTTSPSKPTTSPSKDNQPFKIKERWSRSQQPLPCAHWHYCCKWLWLGFK